MTIAFPCESCGHRFEVDGRLAGKKCRCKYCGHTFLIPVPRESVAKPAHTAKAVAGDGLAAARRSPSPTSANASQTPPSAKHVSEDHDPYGLNEPLAILTPLPPRKSSSQEDEEEVVPPRTSPSVSGSSKSKTKKKRHGSLLASIPSGVYLGIAGVFLVLLIGSFFSTTIGGIFAIVLGLSVLGLYAVGSIGMIVVPFRESVTCGLLYLFLPFYCLYYLVTRWNEMKPWFLITVLGFAMIMGSGLLLPGIISARQAAERARMRNELLTNAPPPNVKVLGNHVPTAPDAEPSPTINTDENIAPPQIQPPAFAPAPPTFAPAPPTMQPVIGQQVGPGPSAQQKAFNARKAARNGRMGGFGPPPSPRPPAAGLPNPSNPTETVTLQVAGVDETTGKRFLEQLQEMFKEMPEPPHFRSVQMQKRMTIQVWPIDDVEEFAGRITWAKINRVRGRTIRLTPNP